MPLGAGEVSEAEGVKAQKGESARREPQQKDQVPAAEAALDRSRSLSTRTLAEGGRAGVEVCNLCEGAVGGLRAHSMEYLLGCPPILFRADATGWSVKGECRRKRRRFGGREAMDGGLRYVSNSTDE